MTHLAACPTRSAAIQVKTRTYPSDRQAKPRVSSQEPQHITVNHVHVARDAGVMVNSLIQYLLAIIEIEDVACVNEERLSCGVVAVRFQIVQKKECIAISVPTRTPLEI